MGDPPYMTSKDDNGMDGSFSIFTESLINSPPDFVLVWNTKIQAAMTKHARKLRNDFEYNLEEEGLQLRLESGESSPELRVVKIWAPLEVLKRYSEILKLRLPIKQLNKSVEHHDNEEVNVLNHPRKIENSSSLPTTKSKSNCCQCCRECVANICKTGLDLILFPTKTRRLTRIYSRDKEYLFDVDENNKDEIFPLSIKARIVEYILQRTAYKSGDDLKRDAFAFGYERLVKQGVYQAGYPVHDGTLHEKSSTRNLLYENWGQISNFFKIQPLDTIRDYFGVSVALYFAWLGFYTRMLILAAVLGFVCFLYGIATFSTDRYVKDVCDESLNITRCPLCDNSCPYWKLTYKCMDSKIAHVFDNDLTVFYALFMSIWAAFFLEFWRRYSATITHQWDLSDFDTRDLNPRPEYVAQLKKTYPSGATTATTTRSSHGGHSWVWGGGVNDDEEGMDTETDKNATFDFDLTLPYWQRTVPYTLLSCSTVLFLVVVVLAAVFGVIVFRIWFTLWLFKDHYEELSWQRKAVSVVAAFVNTIFIMIFELIYNRIAIKLTELECPRTEPEFEASFTVKVYVLQFINNYSPLFYIAFFKGIYAGTPRKYHKLFGLLRQEECGISCMPELSIQLVVTMVFKQGIKVIQEAVFPRVQRKLNGVLRKIKSHKSSKKPFLTNEPSQWEKDYDLLAWKPFSLTKEYLDMVLRFGFVTIFVSAFPLAALFALVSNAIELRIDARKLLKHVRRPIGRRATDIGVWATIIEGVVKIAVLSNACIIAITSNFIPKLMYRFFLGYGSLDGYLQNSLTAYATADLETRPDRKVLERTGDHAVCYFPTYRNDYHQPNKYGFTIEHWQIWLARVVFVILYETIVSMLIVFLCWIIPDVPRSLRQKMQKEERMINELIAKQELLRSRKSILVRHRRSTAEESRRGEERSIQSN